MILDTNGYSVVQWTDYVNLRLSKFGSIPKLDRPEEWQTWAAIVVLLPGISVFAPPDPNGFGDWRSWADSFNRTVQATI